jgi:hypothetical protein
MTQRIVPECSPLQIYAKRLRTKKIRFSEASKSDLKSFFVQTECGFKSRPGTTEKRARSIKPFVDSHNLIGRDIFYALYAARRAVNFDRAEIAVTG